MNEWKIVYDMQEGTGSYTDIVFGDNITHALHNFLFIHTDHPEVNLSNINSIERVIEPSHNARNPSNQAKKPLETQK